jgi:benzoyl-CoA reductase/2-hydroxyglutaryl-CoA dehydratase subunit BcrC/BadD/HgdB
VNELEILRSYYNDSTAFAKEWKANGGKVVGYFCDSVPEEILIAAGFLPVRINSMPGNDIRKAIEKMGRAEGYANSMAARVINGEYSFLDYLVVPHSRDSVHKMYSVFEHIRKENPECGIPELYFLDKAHSSYMTSQLYNRDRILEMKAQIETWSGKEITDSALLDAIAVCNVCRGLLNELKELRRRADSPVSGTEALQIIGASMFMEKRRFNELLRKFLDSLTEGPKSDRVRLYFSGGPQDNVELYKLIEENGAVIIAEDHCWGNRAGDCTVELADNPLEDLIHRYNTKSPCPHNPPLANRIKYFEKCVDESGADGVLFYCIMGDAQAWDIPDELKMLENKGIPAVYMQKQKYPAIDAEKVVGAVTELLDIIKNGG